MVNHEISGLKNKLIPTIPFLMQVPTRIVCIKSVLSSYMRFCRMLASRLHEKELPQPLWLTDRKDDSWQSIESVASLHTRRHLFEQEEIKPLV